jgi:hypothetical protein
MLNTMFRQWLCALLLLALTSSAYADKPDVNCQKVPEGLKAIWVQLSIYLKKPIYTSQVYCQSVPEAGPIGFGIVLSDSMLKKHKYTIRLIQTSTWASAEDGSEDTTAKIVQEFPAQYFPKGIYEHGTDINEPGFFVEIVSMEKEAGNKEVFRYPFKVGTGREIPATTYILVVILAAVGGFIYIKSKKA